MSNTKKIIAVLREASFAPVLFQEDSRILQETAVRLRDWGIDSELLTIDRIHDGIPAPAGLLNMCEGVSSLDVLEQFERRGSRVINRPEAVRNCYRIRMVSMLSEHALPFPKSILIDLSRREMMDDLAKGIDVNRRLWLKRGDVHCTQPGDVRLTRNPWELEEGLKDFVRRGIRHAVLQDHLEGDLVKFYAVKGRPFFQSYIQEPGGTKKPYPRDSGVLKKISSRAADILGLEVYGGDFVVTANGPLLIDINAWPSFAPCFEAAAVEIASRVAQILTARVKT